MPQRPFPPPIAGCRTEADTAADVTSWRALGALALGGLLLLSWRACSAAQRRQRHARHVAAAPAEQTWEGEGGRPLPSETVPGATAARPR